MFANIYVVAKVAKSGKMSDYNSFQISDSLTYHEMMNEVGLSTIL